MPEASKRGVCLGTPTAFTIRWESRSRVILSGTVQGGRQCSGWGSICGRYPCKMQMWVGDGSGA